LSREPKRIIGAEGERTANLLGAAALAIAEAVTGAISVSGGRSEAAKAALAVLLQWPPRSIGHLAKVLRRSHSATVRLIEELEGQGLVAKNTSEDRRAIELNLTAQGRREAQRLIAARGDMLDGMVGRLGNAERRELTRLLEKLLPMLTPDREACDHICRLCELAACPQDRCPVELAAPRAN
jgi:MarR family transcriptional regulator, negative regulator of the multidrug operon emrRAB